MNNGHESNGSSFDLSSNLRQRLRQLNLDRERSQIKLNEANEQLQNLLAKVPKKSKDTNDQLDAKIKELEKKRTQSSIALSAEKDILRQIAAVKKAKTLNDDAATAEKTIKDKKAEIATQKDNIRNLTAQIAELEKYLSRMDLAERLGCSCDDLITHKVDCPEDKLGKIIGKNGMNIKQLEDKSGCVIDIDKVHHQIHIQGNDVAIMSVVNEIETIIRSTTEDIKIDLATYSYLTCKRMAGLNRLEQIHPGVHFDLAVKESTRLLQIRGLPEYLDSVKQSIMALDVHLITLSLSGREASLIIGKGGAQINQLVEQFDVSIDVEKMGEYDEARIVGTGNNPKRAYTRIQEILFQSEDVERSILIRSIIKNKLLSNSGALIKRLQKDVADICGTNVMVNIDKEDRDDQKSSLTTLVVRSPRSSIDLASTQVEHAIQKFESAILSVQLDSDIISSLLEKGGSIINELRDRFSANAEISVSKESNLVLVLSEDHSVKENIKLELEKFAEQNQVFVFKTDASLFGLIFGTKSLRDTLKSLGVVVQKDASSNTIRLRGSSDGITSATFLLNDFISRNYSEDFTFPEEDEQFLYTQNILNKVQEAHHVKINNQKGKCVATVRGEKLNVMACIGELRKILFGNEDYSVTRITVPQVAIGLIIGKGGSGISQLEQKHKGVTISIHRTSNCFCIRGPKIAVDDCRGSLILRVAGVIVSQPLELRPRDYEILKTSAAAVRSIEDETTVEVRFSESLLKIKGAAAHVFEAQGLFEELLHGIYRAIICFDREIIEQIRLCMNQDLVDLIASETNCSLIIDTKQSHLAISGKRSTVRKAKVLLMDAISRSLPDNFVRIYVPKPLVKAIRGGVKLASISAKSGSSVTFDIDTLSIIIQSSSAHDKIIAVDLTQSLLIDSQRLIFILRLEQGDSWISSILNWTELAINVKSATQCLLQPYHEDLMISITGQDEDLVQSAKKMLVDEMDRIRRENIIMDIPEEAMVTFLGRKNANVNSLARDYGVSIERLKKGSNRIRLHGRDVLSAMLAIQDWVAKYTKISSISIGLQSNNDDNRGADIVTKSFQQIPIETSTASPVALDHIPLPMISVLNSSPAISQPRMSASLDEILGSVMNHAEKDIYSSYDIPSTTDESSNITITEEIKTEKLSKASGAQSLFSMLSSGGGLRGSDASHAESRQKTINGATYYMSSSGIAVRI